MFYYKSVLIIFVCIFYMLGDLYSQKASDFVQPAVYYKSRGDYYRYLGKTHDALSQYDKALALKPDYVNCYYWSAVLYVKKGFYFQALYQIAQALKHEDNFNSIDMLFDMHFLEINILMRSNKQLSLVEDKLNILFHRLQDLETQAYHNNYVKNILRAQKGKIYFLKGKYLFSHKFITRLSWLNLALKNNYKKDQVFYFMYLLYKKHNKMSKARYALNKALTLNPNILAEYYRYDDL